MSITTCFRKEIRKISILFGCIKCLIWSYEVLIFFLSTPKNLLSVLAGSASVSTHNISPVQINIFLPTVNPLYTDTPYNDKIHYNDNLTVMRPSLKR